MSNDKVLVIAAHSDDEVLGCGATIARLIQEGAEVSVLFMTNGVGSRISASAIKDVELRQKNSLAAGKILGVANSVQLDFPDNAMDTVPLLDIIREMERELARCQPSIVFSHFLHDLNIDHAVVARAVLTATRPQDGNSVKKLLGFEVNSSTEWAWGSPPFQPNYFVNVTDTFERKINAMRAYEGELRLPPHPRALDSIKALARQRGSTSGFKLAEAFQIYRFLEN